MMGKISRNIVFLAAVVLCTTLLVGVCDAETAKTATEKEVKNPYENSRILIEAFVVEVKLDALYKAGVGPVGQRPNSVSMEKILQCLRDENKAKVTAGAKVAVKNSQDGGMRSSENRYIEREAMRREKDVNQPVPIPAKIFDSYEISTQFSALAYVGPEKDITVEFTFDQSTVDAASKSDRPPMRINRQWKSEVCLEAGKPGIAGATQDGQTVVFLIIAADIENK